MEHRTKLELAQSQLDRILGFFPRVDAKASVVLAVDTAMLGFAAAHIPPRSQLTPLEIGLSIITVALLTCSYWHLYRGNFPNLAGGERSLIYFREIAARTEEGFIDEFNRQDETALTKDFMGQIWRNSQILRKKFNHLRWSFNFLALAVLPWAAVLILFTSQIKK